MCVCAQSCPILCDPMDCSPPGSSVRGILQARILEPVSISYSRGSSQPRDQTASLAPPALAGGFFTTSATWGYFNLKIWICPLKNMFMYYPNTIFLSKNINSDSPIFSNPNSYLKFSICPQNAFSVQFSYSVMSNSLWPYGLQHTRLLCPLPTLGVCSNSCPSSQWCHPTILSSVVPFSSFRQSFPASGSFLMSQFLVAKVLELPLSASVLPMNTQDCSPLGWTGWISLQSKGLSRVFSNTTVQKHQFFCAQLYNPTPTSIHDCWKNHSFD